MMEYLNSINDSLKSINEDEFKFFNVFEHPNLLFGSNISLDKNCCLEEDSRNPNRICFNTSSKKIVFKVELEPDFEDYQLSDWNSRGFDIYFVNNETFFHKTVFSPYGDENIFAEVVSNTNDRELCIYMPNFSVVENMMIGIEINSSLNEISPNTDDTILFLGDNIMRGSSVSRSGNSYPNIINRNVKKEFYTVYNVNTNDINTTLAKKILNTDYNIIVLDIQINESFKKNYSNIERFYQILSTDSSEKLFIYLINDVFSKLNINKKLFRNKNKNVVLYLSNLFNEEELDILIYDKYHFSDYAMQIIANKICEYIE